MIVKRLTPRGTWKSFELFEREAKVLSQLRHAGVPRHLATIEEPPGTFNLVMQRAPGENLRELSARRRLSQLELRDVLVRCLEILDYLHTRIARRSSTATSSRRTSCARPTARSRSSTSAACSMPRAISGGSTIVGTFGYMAPEQLHGQVDAGDRHLRARRHDRRARRRHRARGRPAQGPAHGPRRAPADRSTRACATCSRR